MHSAAERHCGCGFGWQTNWQAPLMQSSSAQLPPGHGGQAPTFGQSSFERQVPPPPQDGKREPQTPFSSQYLSTAVSAQSGSAGSHCEHCSPHILPAHGLYPPQPGNPPAH